MYFFIFTLKKSTILTIESKIIYFIFSLSILSSCKKEVPFIKPQIQSITESVYASGIIKSDDQYQVFANVQGIIIDIYVKEGDRVKKGTALLVVSNNNALLNSENANLAASFYDISAN